MRLAAVARLSAGQERRIDDARTERRGQLARLVVNLGPADSFGRFERHAATACEGALHELSPNRQRCLCAGQADQLVVVEPDPDDRQQFRGEADEPGIAQIVGRARFSGGVEREARAALAPAPVPSFKTVRSMSVTR